MQTLRPYIVTIFALSVYVVFVWVAFGSPLALVTPGSNFSPTEMFIYSDEGYDGQFVYYIARDPLNAAPLIDVPAYRYQRVLLPALGWLLSLGQAPLLPFALLLVNGVALAGSAALLENLLRQHKVSRWYALGYSLSLAALGGARLTLPEPLAYGLCVVGVWLILRDRWLPGAMMFAFAALAKETTLVFAAGVGLHLLIQRKLPQAFTFGAVILVPFAVWQGVLYRWLGSPGIGSGGGGATSFEVIPFMGVVRILTEGGIAAFAALMLILAPAVLLPTFWGLWRCWRDFRMNQWHLYTWLLLVNSAIMLFVPFSTYREPNGILRFIAGLQLAVILYAAHRRNRRALRLSSYWAFTVLLVIASDAAVAFGG
jgi:uncharacterized membrane protein